MDYQWIINGLSWTIVIMNWEPPMNHLLSIHQPLRASGWPSAQRPSCRRWSWPQVILYTHLYLDRNTCPSIVLTHIYNHIYICYICVICVYIYIMSVWTKSWRPGAGGLWASGWAKTRCFGSSASQEAMDCQWRPQLKRQGRWIAKFWQLCRWLRCAGWCLPDQELSAMLQEHAKPLGKFWIVHIELRWHHVGYDTMSWDSENHRSWISERSAGFSFLVAKRTEGVRKDGQDLQDVSWSVCFHAPDGFKQFSVHVRSCVLLCPTGHIVVV